MDLTFGTDPFNANTCCGGKGCGATDSTSYKFDAPVACAGWNATWSLSAKNLNIVQSTTMV
jgi:hypothetical protein